MTASVEHRQSTSGNIVGQLCILEDSLEPRNVIADKAASVRETEEIEDVDLHSGKGHMSSMHSNNIRFARR